MDEKKFDSEDWGFTKPDTNEQEADQPQSAVDTQIEEAVSESPSEPVQASDFIKQTNDEEVNEQNKRTEVLDKKIQRHYRIAGITYIMSILALLILRVVLKNIDIALYDATGNGIDGTLADLFFTMTLQLGVFIIGVLLLHKYGMKMSTREVISQSFIAKPKWWMIVFPLLMGSILLFATMGFSVLWQVIISFFGYIPSSAPSTTTTVSAYMLALFLTGVMPALGEEFMYRGIVLNASHKYGGFWWGVFATALMFGLGHAYIDQIFYATMLGILSGYMTLKFRNILPAVIIHFMNNALSVTLDYLQSINSPIIEGLNNMFAGVAGANGLAVAMGLLILWVVILTIIILLLFAMRHFHNRDIKLKNAMDLSEIVSNELKEQKDNVLDELRSNASQNPVTSVARKASDYPKPLLQGRRLLSFNIRDNVYLLCGFIMAIVATVATLISGLLL